MCVPLLDPSPCLTATPSASEHFDWQNWGADVLHLPEPQEKVSTKVADNLALRAPVRPHFPFRLFANSARTLHSIAFLDRCETSIINHRRRCSNGSWLHEIEACHAISHSFPCRGMASVACPNHTNSNPGTPLGLRMSYSV
jgi:hypothetical protein